MNGVLRTDAGGRRNGGTDERNVRAVGGCGGTDEKSARAAGGCGTDERGGW